MNAPRPPLMTLDDALPALLERAQPLTAHESVATFDADGRVLAQPVVASLQVPPQDNSSMDGYALRCSDVTQPGAVLQVTQRIPAGSQGSPLGPGQAARIFTGAPIPEGADAVVMQEDCEVLEDARVGVRQVPVTGQWIRRSGEDVARGDRVLAVNGTALSRETLADFRYRLALFPQGELRFRVRSPEGVEREETVRSSVTPKPPRTVGSINPAELLGDLNPDVMASRQTFVEQGPALIWRLEAFAIRPEDLASGVQAAATHEAVVLDLRGNGGGFEVVDVPYDKSPAFMKELSVGYMQAAKRMGLLK